MIYILREIDLEDNRVKEHVRSTPSAHSTLDKAQEVVQELLKEYAEEDNVPPIMWNLDGTTAWVEIGSVLYVIDGVEVA